MDFIKGLSRNYRASREAGQDVADPNKYMTPAPVMTPIPKEEPQVVQRAALDAVSTAYQGAKALGIDKIPKEPEQFMTPVPVAPLTPIQKATAFLTKAALKTIPGADLTVSAIKGYMQGEQKPGEFQTIPQKIGEEIGQFAKGAYQGFVKPLLVDPTVEMNMKLSFLDDNKGVTDKLFDSKGRGAGSSGREKDWKLLDEIEEKYDLKRELLNDVGSSLEDRAPLINQIQDEIYVDSLKFSNADINNMPKAWELEDLVNKHKKLKQEINTMKQVPLTEEQKKTQNFTAQETQNYIDKIGVPISDANLQGRKWRGTKLEKGDLYPIIEKFVANKNLQHILIQPKLAKEYAIEQYTKATTQKQKDKWYEYINKAQDLINRNDEKVVPLIQYVVTSLGTNAGGSINDIIETYLKQSKQSFEDIFGESDASNAVLSAVMGMSAPTGADPVTTLLGGIKDMQTTKLNRGDVAQQMIGEMRFKSGNIGQKIMEGIGLVVAKGLENPLNTLKGDLLYSGLARKGFGVLGKMDMESLANVENQIAPPKGWINQTRNGFKDFARVSVQMTPEIMAQIAPSLVGGEIITGLEAANSARLAGNIVKAASESANLMNKGKNVWALSKKLAQYGPQFEAYLAEGKSAAEAAKLISKSDYFMNKVFTQTSRLMLNNYIQSAAMQTHNPKAYSINDFWIDTTFAGIDAIVDTTRLLNHYVKDDLAYKDLFVDTLAKNLRDIPEEEWKLLPIEDKAAFQQYTQGFMDKYNNVIRSSDPQVIKNEIAKAKAQSKNMPIISQVEKRMAADPSRSINYKDAHTNEWIPNYMDEHDYNNVMKGAKTPQDALSLFDQIRQKDKTRELKGLSTRERQKATRETIYNFLTQQKLGKDKNAISGYRNFIKDIENEMGDKGKIRVDGEDRNYEFQSKNLAPEADKTYKDPITQKIIKNKTKGIQQRYTYTLLKDGESMVIDPVTKQGTIIEDATGLPVVLGPDESRSLTFHRAYDPKTQQVVGDFWGTMAEDNIGKTVKDIEQIVPQVGVVPSTKAAKTNPYAFTPQSIMSAEEAAQTEHMLVLNSREITDNGPLQKLHWFSNLSDALKRSGIPNDAFQSIKRNYSIEKDAFGKNIPLSVTLREQAKTGKDLTPEQFVAVKDLLVQSAKDFFPQAPDLVAKIERKLKNLNLVDITRRPELEKLEDALELAQKSGDVGLQKTLSNKITAFKVQVQDPLNKGVGGFFQDLVGHVGTITNDVSVLSRIAGDGGLGEFLKFFDPKKYVDIRDNEEMFKAFFNIDFVPNDWNRYRTLWKYIANDTAEAQWVKGTLKYSGLNAGTYKIGQTLMNIVGMPKMLVMNSLAFAVEQMRKYNIVNYTNKELGDIREKFNILYNTDEYAYKEINNIEGGLNRWMSRVQSRATKVYDSGIYNAADVAYSTAIKNESVGKAIEEILPQLKGADEFAEFIAKQSKESQTKILVDIQQRAEQIINKRTGQFSDYWKSKVTMGGDAGLRSQIKAATYRTYSLMGGRGMGMMHAAAENIAQATQSKLIRGGFGKGYTHILQNEGKYAADKRALNQFTKGEDFLHFTEKLTAAFALGAKQSRMMADADGETDYATSIKEARQLGKNFSFPIQSLQSNPFGRAIGAFLEGLFEDVNNDGRITGMDAAAGGVGMGKQVLNDFFRRFSVIKSVLGATKDAIDNGGGLDTYIGNLISEFKKNTGGFLYYSAQEVTSNGFDLYIPHTANSFLMQIMPYTDKYIKEFQKLSGKASMEKLLTDFDTYGSNRAAYNIPLLKSWNMGGFEDADVIKNVVDIIGQDTFYQDYILKGEIDWSRVSDNMKQYAYAQLTNMSSMGTKYKSDTGWFQDMRKNFNFKPDEVKPGQKVNPDGTVSWPARQNQEDLFVDQMKQALGDGAYNTFVDIFNTSVKGNQKAAVQMIAFAEAQSPGSGKEILANLVSDQWFQMVGDNGGFVGGGVDPKVSNEVEKYLGEMYGNMVFITDKPVGRKNIALYYSREQHPELEKYISDPFDKNGKPMKDMKFIYGKDVDTKSDSEGDYENKIMSQLYAMDLMAKIKVAGGDTDGYKLSNAFATLRMPKNVDNKSAAFSNMMWKGVNHTIDYIDKSHLSIEDKVEMKSGIFVGIYNKLSDYVKTAEKNGDPAFDKSIPDDKLTPEQYSRRESFGHTMRFLHGTTDQLTEMGKAKGAQQYFKDASGYSIGKDGGSSYYSDKFKYPSYLSEQMRQLSYLFSPYKSYGTSYKSKGNYYGAKDRDYLVQYGKGIGTGVARISDFAKGIPTEVPPSGRTPSQKAGAARPFTKREDPDKPFDFTTVSTMKRKLSRKAIRYDNSGTRKSGLGGGLYNVSYQGGNRKRRVSRPKGSNAKGSTKYYKTSR